MNIPDPLQAGAWEDLVECLRLLRIQADRPSLRTLETRTKRGSGELPGTRLKRVPLGRTAVGEVLAGQKFPGKAFLLTLVEACGVDLETDQRWAQAWDQLAPQYLDSGKREAKEHSDRAAEVEAGTQDLRRQLTDAETKIHELEQVRQQLAMAWDQVRQFREELDRERRLTGQLQQALEQERTKEAADSRGGKDLGTAAYEARQHSARSRRVRRQAEYPDDHVEVEQIAKVLMAGPVVDKQFPDALGRLGKMPGSRAAEVLARLNAFILQAVLGYLDSQPASWRADVIKSLPDGPQKAVAADRWNRTRSRR
jgi:hypothetical protein